MPHPPPHPAPCMLQMKSIPSDLHSFGPELDSSEVPLLNPMEEVRQRVIAPHDVLAAVGAVVASVVLFIVGAVMTGRPYGDPCEGFEFTICSYTGCYTATQFFGTLFVMAAIPLTCLALGWLPQVPLLFLCASVCAHLYDLSLCCAAAAWRPASACTCGAYSED